MASKVWNPEWYARNSVRSYPLVDDVSGKDTTGSFTIPDNFIVAASISVHVANNVDPASLLIGELSAYGQGFIIKIGYWNGVSVVDVAVAAVSRQTHVRYNSYPIRGLGDFADTTGTITIGSLDSIDLQPQGVWGFDLDGARLEPDAVRPQIRGVTGLRVQNGSTVSDPVVGDVVLRAGQNARFTLVEEAGEDPVIVWDAIEGEGLNEECVCTTDLAASPAIRTINQIPGDATGDFRLSVDDCFDLQEIESGLRLVNTCSAPCCGCNELEVITQTLEDLKASQATAEGIINRLQASVDQTDQAILGSKLGDRGCNTCP